MALQDKVRCGRWRREWGLVVGRLLFDKVIREVLAVR